MRFSYYLPTRVIFGYNSLERLGEEVKKLNAENVLIVTDKFIAKTGMIDRVTSLLSCRYDLFDEVEPEPSIEVAEQAAKKVRSSNYDLVIGFGGGSSIDIAKLASLFATNKGDVISYVGNELFANKGIPSIMIPTTAGTGAEVTVTSMVTVSGHKKWINSQFLLPTIAMVDPELTISMPPKVTAATGLDALCHNTEAYLSNGANPITDSVALEGIRLIISNIERAYENGQDRVAREAMSLAALLGGIALQARMVYGHSIAYTIATRFNLPHGISCAIPLPYIVSSYAMACAPKMQRLAEAYGLKDIDDPVKLGKKIGERIKELLVRLNIPTTLRELGVSEPDLPVLARECLEIYYRPNSPLVLDEDGMLNLYRMMWSGNLLVDI